MATPTRQDTWNVTAVIDGLPSGTWDKLSGGSGDSEELKYRPGNMGSQISLGGSQTLENITLSRLFDLDRDALVVKKWLARRGNAPVVVTKQPKDIDGNTYGEPLVYTGILKAVTPPDVDSEGGDAAMVAIEVTTNGTVA